MKELIMGLLWGVIIYAMYRGYTVRFGGKGHRSEFFFEVSRSQEGKLPREKWVAETYNSARQSKAK